MVFLFTTNTHTRTTPLCACVRVCVHQGVGRESMGKRQAPLLHAHSTMNTHTSSLTYELECNVVNTIMDANVFKEESVATMTRSRRRTDQMNSIGHDPSLDTPPIPQATLPRTLSTLLMLPLTRDTHVTGNNSASERKASTRPTHGRESAIAKVDHMIVSMDNSDGSDTTGSPMDRERERGGHG